jgi:hypothetical protein
VTSEYIEHLREFLLARPVVIVAAMATRQPLGPGGPLTPWLAWQANIAEMNLAESPRFVPLITRAGVPTCGAFLSSRIAWRRRLYS